MPLQRTKIGWADYSGQDLNFVIGCTPVSAGCANCYAAAWAKRCSRDFSKVTLYWDKLERLGRAIWEPSNRPYRRGPGSRPIMFPVDLGDLFHPQVPMDMILAALHIFAAKAASDWVLLTKRPDRMREVTDHWLCLYGLEKLPPNIWCLTTTENQHQADERIPVLLQVKARVLGISMEPMLEPMSLERWLPVEWSELGHCWIAAWPGAAAYKRTLSWVILGAESGPHRRPFDPRWASELYEQCAAAGVPFFGKQDSGLYPGAVLHLPCSDCGGSGYLSDGLGSGEFCGCNGQRWEVKEFPGAKLDKH